MQYRGVFVETDDVAVGIGKSIPVAVLTIVQEELVSVVVEGLAELSGIGSGASTNSEALVGAAGSNIGSLAFPGISTGIYGFPVERAVPIAVSTVRAAIEEFLAVRDVVFCCFSSADLLLYRCALGEPGDGHRNRRNPAT